MTPRQAQIKAVSDLLEVSESSSSEQERSIGIKACLHLLEELKQDESDHAELNFLQGFAWYISPGSEKRDEKVLAFLSAALELDFEHQMAKVYLCHYLFDIGDHAEFLKHYQQLNVSQFKNWRRLKFLEMNLIAKINCSSVNDAEVDHFINNYENAQDTDRPKIQDLFNFFNSNENKLSENLKKFTSKWSNYWNLDYAE